MKLKKVLSAVMAVAVMLTTTVTTCLTANATLLPIQTYEAEAILDDYTKDELSQFTLKDLLNELVYSDTGEKIDIAPNAKISWASNDLKPNDEYKHRIGYDNFSFANENTRIPIAINADTDYEVNLKLIVGSGKQLDPDNICYNVKISYTKPYTSSDEYKLYTLVDGVKTELEIINAQYYSVAALLYINEPITENTPIYIEYCGKLVKTSKGEEVDADMNVNYDYAVQDEHGWLIDSSIYPRYTMANVTWTDNGNTLHEIVRYINIYSESNESVNENENDRADPSDSPFEYNADFYIHSVYPSPLENYDKIDCFSTKQNNTTYIRAYDSSTIDGHQTFFITKKDGSDIDMSSIMLELDAKITSLQVYNETEGKMTDVCTEPQDFSKNNTIHYSLTNSKGKEKHYWITVNAVNEGGSKLFVDGPSERTVYFNACHGWKHDILIANTGDEELTGLSVKLTDAKNVKLDEYWTVGGNKNDTLAPFTTSDINKMANLANIRLLPTGTDGEISGKLTIKADGQKEVVINLKGLSGDPSITTDELDGVVKYIPYSAKLTTNNIFDWNELTSVEFYGDLPEGLEFNENTLEVYGIPQETGTFKFQVMLIYSVTGYSSNNITLTVKENTNQNVFNSTDEGYSLKTGIGQEILKNQYFLSETDKDQLFVSEGDYNEFIDLWLNGEKLTADEDYTIEEGSTRITIKASTLQELEDKSSNTLAAEFRVGGTADGELKITAQNFSINSYVSTGGSGGSGGSGGTGGSGGGGSIPSAPATSTNPEFNGTPASWSTIATNLSAMSNGNVVTIMLNGNYDVPVEVIEAISQRNIKATFIVDTSRSWYVDGALIKTPAAADLCILTLPSLNADDLRGTAGIKFRTDGTNIPTDMILNFVKSNAGKFANLYKADGDKLVFIGNVKVDENGKITLPLNEKGDYVIMLCEFSDKIGDVDNDGVTNAKDASAILKHIVEIEECANSVMLDYNGDGKANSADASALLKDIVNGI